MIVLKHWFVPKWEMNCCGEQRCPPPDAKESEQESHCTSKKSRTGDSDDGPPDTPGSGASTINRPTSSDAAKAKRKRNGVASSSTHVVIWDEFINELRAMRIMREKKFKAWVKMEKKKINANLLIALLVKPNLTAQEEHVKNRLMAEYF